MYLCTFHSCSARFFPSLVCVLHTRFLSSKTSIISNLLIYTGKPWNLFCHLSWEFIQMRVVTHLEEVILVDHTAVGQVLDESVGKGGFPSIGDSAWNKAIRKTTYGWCNNPISITTNVLHLFNNKKQLYYICNYTLIVIKNCSQAFTWL